MLNINTKISLYSDIRNQIKSGDILLCSGKSIFSKLIQGATNSPYSHVAFILRVDSIDRILVLESVESIGVRTVTLRSYLNDYNGTGNPYDGSIMIARHAKLDQKNIPNLSQYGMDRLGYPYNSEEIAEIAARIALKGLFNKDSNLPVNPKSFICSEYAYDCYKSVGIEINYDKSQGFIYPADFAKDENVKLIGLLK